MVSIRKLTEHEFNRQMRRLQAKNVEIERKRQLVAEKHRLDRKFKMPSTSKIIMVWLLLVMNIVLVFGMLYAWKYADSSVITIIASAIFGELGIYLGYLRKSRVENSKNGLVYEAAMRKLDAELNQNYSYEGTDTEEYYNDDSSDESVG